MIRVRIGVAPLEQPVARRHFHDKCGRRLHRRAKQLHSARRIPRAPKRGDKRIDRRRDARARMTRPLLFLPGGPVATSAQDLAAAASDYANPRVCRSMSWLSDVSLLEVDFGDDVLGTASNDPTDRASRAALCDRRRRPRLGGSRGQRCSDKSTPQPGTSWLVFWLGRRRLPPAAGFGSGASDYVA